MDIFVTKILQREQNRVQLALRARLSMVPDCKAELDDIFDKMKHSVAVKTAKMLVGEVIVSAVKEILSVPEYSQKGSAKQCIFVYVGTHWEQVPIQVYYDFVKEAAYKAGLKDIYVEDEVFMNPVFENVAFRVARHMVQVQPAGEVWINMLNGTLEIHSDGNVCLHDHRADDNFRYVLPYAYEPGADCPMWHRFLDEVMPEEDLQILLGEYIGYCFTRDMKLEKMAVFYGTGANGKSVCLDVIKNLAGSFNVSNSTLSSVTMDPEARSQIEDKLINISDESASKLDTAILKQLISGEPTEVRKLYVGTHIMRNIPKFFTSFNALPPTENTYGYMRRWLLFPFSHTIPAERQDYGLAVKLCTELPGIMNWVLSLLVPMMQRVNSGVGMGFSQSITCQKAVDEYMVTGNNVLLFFNDVCHLDGRSQINLRDFYQEYRDYCASNGITKPYQRKNFKKIVLDCGVTETLYQGVKYYNVRVDRE